MDWRTSFVYNKNGTLQEVTEDFSQGAAGFIILLCFLLGVTYNFIVTSSILFSSKLRRSPSHLAFGSVTAVCLLDCFTNESLAVGFLFRADVSWCRSSAIVFQFFLLTHSSALSLLCLERTLDLYEHPMAIRMCLGAVLSMSIYGLLFTPLTFTAEVHYFPNRNACSAINIWSPIVALLGFLLNWILQTIIFILCITFVKKYLKERKQLTILSIFPTSNNENQNPSDPQMNCYKNKISYTIFFLHIILIFPQMISVSVHLFYAPVFEPDPWIDPRVSSAETRMALSNDLEPLFTYLHYMYNVVVPIVVLILDRDVRQQSRIIFCCRRNVISSSDLNFPRASNILESNLTETICDLRTPVLFATKKGLHLRAPQSENPSDNLEWASVSRGNPRLVTRFCDLVDSGSAEPVSFVTRGIEENNLPLNEESPAGKRNVRFSSKVEAISPLQHGGWTPGNSETQIINTPLLVKNERVLSNGVFTKIQ